MEIPINRVSIVIMFKIIFLVATICFFMDSIIANDSLYAKKIDSLWRNSRKEKRKTKTIHLHDTTLIIYYFKNSGACTILANYENQQPRYLLFYYLDSNTAMVSPVGQQPYFIKNNVFVYGREIKHTEIRIREFIELSHRYYALSRGKLTKKNHNKPIY